jgi:aminoglycoside 3-N-acetyltransferase
VITGLKALARRIIPAPAWQAMKHTGRRYRRLYFQHLRGFGPAELSRALRSLGVEAGDVLMVHSAWEQLPGFHGTPKDAIDVLLEAVDPNEGTVLMPTMPFGGSAIDWAAEDPLFNARRTPSAMGLMSEVFRRGDQVVRSLHPTHSVAARGPLAQELTSDHHLSDDPCGAETPWMRLVDVDAKILFLGATVRANTMLHGVQSVLGPEWTRLHPQVEAPLQGLTTEYYAIRTLLPDGEVHVCRTRLYDRLHVKHMRGERAAEWLS